MYGALVQLQANHCRVADGFGFCCLLGWEYPDAHQASNAFRDYAAPDGTVHNASELSVSVEEMKAVRKQGRAGTNDRTIDDFIALRSCNGFTYSGILDNMPTICKPKTCGDDKVLPSFNVVRFEKAIDVIQRAWRNSLYDPTFRVCRKRLLLEFDELMHMS